MYEFNKTLYIKKDDHEIKEYGFADEFYIKEYFCGFYHNFLVNEKFYKTTIDKFQNTTIDSNWGWGTKKKKNSNKNV